MATQLSSSDASPAPQALRGIGVSPGVAVGPALVFRPRLPADATATASRTASVVEETRNVERALAAAAQDLRRLAQRVAREVGNAEAGIFEAQALMLEDPTILERARALIASDGRDGAAALEQAADEQAKLLADLPDPVWQARAADVRDAARRAARYLAPHTAGEDLTTRLAQAPEPVIVVADDLAPSDTAQMSRETVLGICTVAGGATAHTAILARALDIPAVAGLGEALFAAVAEGDRLAVDGASGEVFVRPEAGVAQDFTIRASVRRAQRESARAAAQGVASHIGQTRDGTPIAVLANVGSVAEARSAGEWGAEGIGLLRTEFLFAERTTLPDEHEQAALYTAIVAALGRPGATVVVRTLDAGNDKPLPALAPYTRELPSEANPALGIRGFRLYDAFPALLETQLRGIVRAAATTGAELHVMLPMIATVEELLRARMVLRDVEAALASQDVRVARPLKLGIMIETPAAVLNAAALAREADFFSLGTNDLAQYVMASDRLNPRLIELTDARQPAVLRAIAQAAAAGREAGRTVAVCGEMAGDPQLAGLLVGLGVNELSMSPASIVAVKQALAERAYTEYTALAARALAASTREEVVAALRGAPSDAAT